MGLKRVISAAVISAMVLLSVATAAFAAETYSGWKKLLKSEVLSIGDVQVSKIVPEICTAVHIYTQVI